MKRQAGMIGRLMLGVALGAGMIAMTGCATHGTIGAPAAADNNGTVAVEAATRLLNVSVTTRPGDSNAERVAEAVRKAVEGRLAEKRFAMNAGEPDILVELGVKVIPFDKSGSYFRFNGQADVKAVRCRDERLLGQHVVAVAGERKLGLGESLSGLSEKMGGEVAEWAVGACLPLQTELGANDITVHRRLPALASNDPEYVAKFVGRVGALKGIVSCRLVQHDYNTRTMVFRVVYYRDLFPEGLLNRLALDRELGIRLGN